MILFRLNNLNILIDMSLTKAAEVLNKMLQGESSGGSVASVVPPVLMPPEWKNSLVIDQESTKSDSLSNHVQNVYLQYSNYKAEKGSMNNINENSFVNVSQLGAANESSSDGDAVSTINEEGYFTDLDVVTVPHNSSLIPFLEQFFKLKKDSDSSISVLEGDEFTPLDPNKYKTELCRSYQVHGYCKYGIRCNYAHGLTQIKVAYRHGKYKTRNCQSYHESGFCRYGARCSFIHDAEEGILKCPITDREVLEALHYRPMSEFHHIATITWRMIEHDSYPPTEVHFFTPSIENQIAEISDDSFYKNPLYFDKSLIENLETTLCSELSRKDRAGSNKARDENKSGSIQMDQNKTSSLPIHSFSETSSESLKNFEILNSQQNSPCDENFRLSKRFNEVEVSNQIEMDNMSKTNKNKENETKSKSFSRGSKSLSHPPESTKRSHDNSRPWTKNLNTVEKYSNYSFSFNLNDLLNCLKTREGQQHLASWASEAERRNSSSSTTDSSLSQRSTPDFSYKRQTVRSGRDLSKYKTELCRSYQYNKYCEYNESCLYAHGTEDLRSYPKHPLYRSKKCFSFHKKGFCLYGSRCQFLHDIEIPFLQ